MKTEMKVLLYIKRSGQDKDGLSPLMGRIAVRGKNNSIAQFSCKFKVDVRLLEKPRDFDPFGQTGLSPLATI